MATYTITTALILANPATGADTDRLYVHGLPETAIAEELRVWDEDAKAWAMCLSIEPSEDEDAYLAALQEQGITVTGTDAGGEYTGTWES